MYGINILKQCKRILKYTVFENFKLREQLIRIICLDPIFSNSQNALKLFKIIKLVYASKNIFLTNSSKIEGKFSEDNQK